MQRTILVWRKSVPKVTVTFKVTVTLLIIVSTSDTSFDAAVNPSQIFPHHRFVIGPVADVHLRNGFAFEGDDMGADSME